MKCLRDTTCQSKRCDPESWDDSDNPKTMIVVLCVTLIANSQLMSVH